MVDFGKKNLFKNDTFLKLNANSSFSSAAGTGGMPPPPCYEELEEFSTPRDEMDEKAR